MRKEGIPQSDDIAYRDYLLECIDLYVTKPAMPPLGEVFTKGGSGSLSAQDIRKQTLQNLRKRFKQDFGTTDNTVTGSNRVAIVVMKAILIEELTFAAKAIPVQGNLSNRIYLDKLIALSNNTADSISSTYRIDLSRLDYEPTTYVRENILTLQSHLRDDKFNQGCNPFFLYKEEWRLRFQTPFFAENHYTFKKGLFATSADRNRALAFIKATMSHKDYQPDFSPANAFVARFNILLNLDSNLTQGHDRFAAEDYGLARYYYSMAESDVNQLVGQMSMHVVEFSSNGIYIREETRVPNLCSAEGFRNSLFPTKTDGYLFGQMPQQYGHPNWLTPMQFGGGGSQNSYWKIGLKEGQWDPIDIAHGKIPPEFPYTTTLSGKLVERYDGRNAVKVDSVDSLDKLEARNVVMVSQTADTFTSYHELETAFFNLHDDLVSLVPHVMFLMLPICQGDVAAAIGDFPAAAKSYAQVATEQLFRGTLMTGTPFVRAEPNENGDLPWTWVSSPPIAIFWAEFEKLVGQDYPYLNKDCELPFLRLRLGALYLTWADQLYSTDQESEVYRARELYKAVLRQYGIDPLPGAGLVPLPYLKMATRPSGVYRGFEIRKIPLQPPPAPAPVLAPHPPAPAISKTTALPAAFEDRRLEGRRERIRAISARLGVEVSRMNPATRAAWGPLIDAGISPQALAQPDTDFASPFLSGAYISIVADIFLSINPAILAQQMRARIGITQIDAGLNYYGYSDNLVPLLRYRPLATAAQHFATLARQAQADFLSYKEHAENAELGLIQARAAVATAAVRVQIESQRNLQAQDYVEQAKIQVEQIQDAIAAKEAEIADHNGICGQVKDFFGGIKDFFTGVPDEATKYIKSDFSAAFGFENAAAGATAGLGVVGGIALFGVATGVTLSGVADRANQRVSELQKLQTQQLPMGMVALDARTREMAIAELQMVVAKFDVMTAQEILRYSFLRTLNVDMWIYMASAIKSVLRRYLNLGAMAGWLAERALSYAQDRDLRLIRFDYFKLQRQGVMGADELQAGLAALEKEYITGFQQEVPIKWTVSLARDFPLQFGQLKAKGRCAFMTSASPLDLAHPGFFSHRIRAIEVAATLPVVEPPPRGLLSNPGVSRVAGANLGDEHEHTLVRPPDIFPLSEFRLKDDMVVYELPGETLMPFEGSGLDTLWLIEFPAAANLVGLSSLAVICITFHLQARFSPSRRADLAKAGAPTLTRSVLFSARKLFPESLKEFVAGGDGVALKFTITHDLLPVNEKNRQVTNLAIFFLGKDLPEVKGKLVSDHHPQAVKFTTDGELAHSNYVLPPAIIPVQPAPLNVLAAGTPEQKWMLTVLGADNPKLDRKAISDVILGIEYTTKPAF